MVCTWHVGFSLMGGTNWVMGRGMGTGYMQMKYCSIYNSCVFANITTVFTKVFYTILQHSKVSTTHDRGILRCVV